jgi:hypothetical protein
MHCKLIRLLLILVNRLHSFLLLHRKHSELLSTAAVPDISKWSGDPKRLAVQLHHVLLLCFCKIGAMMQDPHIDRLAQDLLLIADLAN